MSSAIMKNKASLIMFSLSLILAIIACEWNVSMGEEPTLPPTATAIRLPPRPLTPISASPDEPVFISGEIPYTSPFFLNLLAEPFVMLEDQAGFVQRNREFQFALSSQIIGPVIRDAQDRLTFFLVLPAIPLGTFVDVDHDGESDQGVQVFAVAFWSNTWGDPFLEARDGTGWSTAYASTITDPDNHDEIIGGTLIVWAPDGEQSFPIGFGEDQRLFTEDDPIEPIPPGYNLVDLNQEPFRIYKEAQPKMILHEGIVALNDFSEMSYKDAFLALFEKVSVEYPFTQEKGIDWERLKAESLPLIENARNDSEFYEALYTFAQRIPDGHVNLSLDADDFYKKAGGGFGLVLAELSDGRVIATQVLEDMPADRAGMRVGAEILTWNDMPVGEAIAKVVPYLGSYSTPHTLRLAQVNFLERVPPNTEVKISFRNPGSAQITQAKLRAIVEYDSFFKTIPSLNQDELDLPIEGHILEDSGIAYIRISTFSEDYHLLARLWEHYLQGLIDAETPALILDLRSNGGGSVSIAMDFAGYFFKEEQILYTSFYFNAESGQFEEVDLPTKVRPAPLLYEGPLAVLIGPHCVSACEGFVYALSQNERAIMVGHYPTAGAFGEVGRGQYKLPGDFTLQFPTGRSETLQGELLIEGKGIEPQIRVPVTLESALGEIDAVLQAAIEALLEIIS